MRQIDMCALVAESELNDLHAGNVEALAKFAHVLGDVTKVFGNEGQVAEFILQGLEETVVRTGCPVTVNGGGVVGRDLPARFEAAEMVKTNDVAVVEGPAHAVDPPVVAALLKGLPVVKRISPALAGFAESVGRDTGDDFAGKVGFQAKNFGICPDIGAVIADEDGDIADDLGSPISAVGSK